MSNEDIQKKIVDAVMGFTKDSDGMVPDSTALVNDLGEILQEIQASGALPTEEIEKQMAELSKLEAHNIAINAAIADGDYEALEKISQQTAEICGLGSDAFAQEPEIFDAIEDADLQRITAALKDWDVNQTHGKYNKTALYAAMSGFDVSLDVINALLTAGADPQIGLTDCNVLHGLGFGQMTEISAPELADVIKRCINLGAELEQRTENLQWTPLHTALNEWNVVASEALLLAGADPNACAGNENRACTRGQSSLRMSIGYPELFSLLLDYGADPDEMDEYGRSVASQVDRLLMETDCDEFRAKLTQTMEALQRHKKPV